MTKPLSDDELRYLTYLDWSFHRGYLSLKGVLRRQKLMDRFNAKIRMTRAKK